MTIPKLTPFGQGGGSGLFESIAAVEMALVVEMVVDRGVNGGEFLQGLDVSERHCQIKSAWSSLPVPFLWISGRKNMFCLA